MITHATYYSRRGWAVLPLHWVVGSACSCGRRCDSPGKHPLLPRGVHEASAELTYVETWWHRWPQANIGIATGAVSGLVVLDVDGAKGRTSLSCRPVPPTVRVFTGHGEHHYFEHPGQCTIKNAVGLAPGLDIRADGGYVVAPPSLHASGRNYAWADGCVPGEVELAPAPGWLFDALFAKRNADRRFSRACRGLDPSSIPAIGEGERNKILASIAGRLRWEDRPQAEAESFILRVNNASCRPPLPEREVLKIVRSIWRYAR
jgi:hypothetical protein